jgi:hypothetical protein
LINSRRLTRIAAPLPIVLLLAGARAKLRIAASRNEGDPANGAKLTAALTLTRSHAPGDGFADHEGDGPVAGERLAAAGAIPARLKK